MSTISKFNVSLQSHDDKREGRRSWEVKKCKKYKILAVILVAALAISTVAALGPTIATWVDTSLTQLTAKTATATFTTSIVGVSTNAISSPLNIDGYSITSANIGNYQPAVQYGDPNTLSNITITASGFVPNDYVEFAVTITNTGTATETFQAYTYVCEFVNAQGVPTSWTSPIDGLHSSPKPPVVNAWTNDGFNGAAGGGVPSGTTLSTPVFINELIGTGATSYNTNWEVAWGSTSVLPTTLAPGATFTYNLYVGLGSNVPYGIPGCYFSLSIPLAPAPTPTPTPTPTPKPTACPTPTPKPTPPPTPTHTPCPTPTPKPTPTPTPTRCPK